MSHGASAALLASQLALPADASPPFTWQPITAEEEEPHTPPYSGIAPQLTAPGAPRCVTAVRRIASQGTAAEQAANSDSLTLSGSGLSTPEEVNRCCRVRKESCRSGDVGLYALRRHSKQLSRGRNDLLCALDNPAGAC